MYSSSNKYPRGFLAGGLHCGIKKDQSKKDLALVYSNADCVSHGVFTQNKFCAAPVVLCKRILDQNKNSNIRSVIVDSGCANAVTGQLGLENASKMVDLTDRSLKNNSSNAPQTLVMSTGVIGHHLAMDKIQNGINQLAKKLENSDEGWVGAAEGFMTTDTRPKLITKDTNKYKFVGISKGAGMIHPNMATLLSLVCSDVAISKECLIEALEYATPRSFNSISIDGDTSTNDTCLVLCNGMANNKQINDKNSNDFKEFRDELTQIMVELAQLIIKDAEGATKFVTVRVKNANNYENAKKMVSTISTSSLVKTALYGNDANWGRIICAIGYSGIEEVVPEKVDLKILALDENNNSISEIELLKNGAPLKMDEEHALKVMKNKNLELLVNLNVGTCEAVMWTCDLSHEYVTINGSYRS